jgi:hypothetical protein
LGGKYPAGLFVCPPDQGGNMNFDFGKVLSRSWQIIWKHKVLWIFGILANGIITAYIQSAWTLTFMQLSKPQESASVIVEPNA